MTADEIAYRDLFATGDRAVERGAAFSLVDSDGTLQGPPSIWMRSLPAGRALEQLAGVMRFGLELPARAQEAAILAVGSARGSEFELFAHRRAAAVRGLTPEEIEGICAGSVPSTLDGCERTAVHVARILAERRLLDEEAYAAAVNQLGLSGMVELVLLVTYYDMLATQLSAFEVEVPAGWRSS